MARMLVAPWPRDDVGATEKLMTLGRIRESGTSLPLSGSICSTVILYSREHGKERSELYAPRADKYRYTPTSLSELKVSSLSLRAYLQSKHKKNEKKFILFEKSGLSLCQYRVQRGNSEVV